MTEEVYVPLGWVAIDRQTGLPIVTNGGTRKLYLSENSAISAIKKDRGYYDRYRTNLPPFEDRYEIVPVYR